MGNWFLEGYFGHDGAMARLPLQRFPFRIGRQRDLDCTVKSDELSRVHAELFEEDGQLFVRDLHSTNGTCVNHALINDDVRLQHGDVLHFAHIECRILRDDVPQRGNTGFIHTVVGAPALSNLFPTGVNALQEMIAQRQVATALQGIFDAHTESLIACEILGRGGHPHLPTSPIELFRIAESIGLAVDLSELLRDEGVAYAAACGVDCPVFFNTHPSEMHDIDRLLGSIRTLRHHHPGRTLVLEIHEQAVSGIGAMRTLKHALASLDIELAYDDFGAGQARLLELVEAPPDYLKFDRSLIYNIDKAPANKLQLLQALREAAYDLRITTLAEGVGQAGEARVCKALGFDLLQGYYYHRPSPHLPSGTPNASRSTPSRPNGPDLEGL